MSELKTFLLALQAWLGENVPVPTSEFAKFVRVLTPEEKAEYKQTLRELGVPFAETTV